MTSQQRTLSAPRPGLLCGYTHVRQEGYTCVLRGYTRECQEGPASHPNQLSSLIKWSFQVKY